MSDLVSVVIPCYRQAHFLGEAIESVLAQTHPHIEITVIDDGSPDDVARVAARYERVRCFRQANAGLAAARNAGFRQSGGAYLLFLDADDRLVPGAVARAVALLEARPEIAFAYGHVRLIDAAGAPLPTPPQTGVHDEHYRALLASNYIWTPGTVLYRRAVLEEAGGFDTAVSAAADYDLNLRITRQRPVCCTDAVALEYRTHGISMSGNPAVMLRDSVLAFRAQRPYVEGSAALEAAYRRGLRAICRGYGEPLIDRVLRDLRARTWRRALHGLALLLLYYRTGVVQRPLRKARALLRRGE